MATEKAIVVTEPKEQLVPNFNKKEIEAIAAYVATKLAKDDPEGIYVSEEELQAAFQADKDVISQIKYEYNEATDKMTITFPENIVPLEMYEDEIFGENVYFDYQIRKMREDEFDTSVDDRTSISINNSHIVLTVTGSSSAPIITNMIYMNFRGNAPLTFNSHRLLKPNLYYNPLYQHNIVIIKRGSDSFGPVSFQLTNTRSDAYTTLVAIRDEFERLGLNDDLEKFLNCVCFDRSNADILQRICIITTDPVGYEGVTFSVEGQMSSFTISGADSLTISDAVVRIA